MFCAKCGLSVLEGSAFCASCGTAVGAAGTAAGPAPVAAAAVAPTTGEAAHYAGFWRRVAASLVDSLLLVAVLLAVVLALKLAGVAERTFEIVYAAVSWIGGWLYYALLHSSPQQATFGKRAIGIKVTDLQGGRIGFGRATGRYFATILSSLTLGIGFAMAGFTRQRQALHDMVASTLVVSGNATPQVVASGRLQAPRLTGGVIALAIIAGLVPVAGIVAAITIPAYQDYIIRSQVADGLTAAAAYKAAVAEAYAAGQAFADMQSDTLEVAPAAISPYVSAISLSDGVVVVEFGGDAHERLAGTQLLLVPGATADEEVVWTCGLAAVPDGVTPAIDAHTQYTNVPTKFLPPTCRGE